MKPRTVFLITGLIFSIGGIVLILMKGDPSDQTNFNTLSELGESVLHHAHKTTEITWEISSLEEMEIGQKIHDALSKRRFANELKEGELQEYVDRVGQRIVKNVKRKEMAYKFHVLKSPIENASSVAGGHVYITTGLIESLNSEAELAGILGHEMVHIDAKHAVDSIGKTARHSKQQPNIAVYVVVGFHLSMKPGYSEYQEYEADQGGVYLAAKAGYHPLAIVSAFENVLQKNTKETHARNTMTPVGDTAEALGGIITRYFKTHPISSERIDKIQKYLRESKLMESGTAYYIGVKNLLERIPYGDKSYEDERSRTYPDAKKIMDENLDQQLKDTPTIKELSQRLMRYQKRTHNTYPFAVRHYLDIQTDPSKLRGITMDYEKNIYSSERSPEIWFLALALYVKLEEEERIAVEVQRVRKDSRYVSMIGSHMKKIENNRYEIDLKGLREDVLGNRLDGRKGKGVNAKKLAEILKNEEERDRMDQKRIQEGIHKKKEASAHDHRHPFEGVVET